MASVTWNEPVFSFLSAVLTDTVAPPPAETGEPASQAESRTSCAQTAEPAAEKKTMNAAFFMTKGGNGGRSCDRNVTNGGRDLGRRRRGLPGRLGRGLRGIGPDQIGKVLLDAGERRGILQERVEPPLHGHDHLIGQRPDVHAQLVRGGVHDLVPR